jgi:hypothetical protein
LTMLSLMNSLLLSMPVACKICSYKSLSLPSEEICQSVTYASLLGHEALWKLNEEHDELVR